MNSKKTVNSECAVAEGVTGKVLLAAYHFPPAGGLGAAGSQRALKFARHLPAAGYKPFVLTVKESKYDSYISRDDALLAQVPKDLRVIRTGVLRGLQPLLHLKAAIATRWRTLIGNAPTLSAASSDDYKELAEAEPGRLQKIKDSITDLFAIPDEVAGWILPAIVAGRRAIRREQIDVIFATGRPWSTLVIGAALKRLTGKVLVVDFRDPWMTNPFRLPYSAVKNGSERWLERWVVDSADLIVANTEGLRSEFIDRFGPKMERRCITILNGFDPDEFATVRPEARDCTYQNAFVIVHSGFLYGKRDPLDVLGAIIQLHRTGKLDDGEFLLDFIGPIELSYDVDRYVRDNDLLGIVRLRGPVSYAESLSALAGCNLALLLQPGTKTQVPSKLFEYVGFGKRMLTIAPSESAVADIVRENGLGNIVEPGDVNEIAKALECAYLDWKRGNSPAGLSGTVRSRFDVRHSVAKLGKAMAELTEDC